MGTEAVCAEIEAQMVALTKTMVKELGAWRETHPDASLDDIAAQVTVRRRKLMGELIAELACQNGNGVALEGVNCPECGQRMVYKGGQARTVEHSEGEINLTRAYYYCPACRRGFFPPRYRSSTDQP
jgi:hypothetical protein